MPDETTAAQGLAEMDKAACRKKLAELEQIAAGKASAWTGRGWAHKRLTAHGHALLSALRRDRDLARRDRDLIGRRAGGPGAAGAAAGEAREGGEGGGPWLT